MWTDPPATISAPDATRPITVTSPSGCRIDWPERTLASIISEVVVGVFFEPAAGVASSSVTASAPAGRPPVTRGGSSGPTRVRLGFSTAMTRMWRRARALSSSRYSSTPILSPAISRITGFEAKKAGERASQASTAASHSETGRVGSRTKARSERALKLMVWRGLTCAVMNPVHWRFINYVTRQQLMKR